MKSSFGQWLHNGGEKVVKLYKKYELLLFALGFLAIAILLRITNFDQVSGDLHTAFCIRATI